MLLQYSNNNYFDGDNNIGYIDYISQEISLKATYERLLNKLNRVIPLKGEMLEIGCPHGFFLSSANQYFNKLSGTDFSEKTASIARNTGASVYCGGIEKIPSGKIFDFIFLIQVIEHVYSPVEFLKGCVKLLNPGGYIVIYTPNIGSGWFKLMGKKVIL